MYSASKQDLYLTFISTAQRKHIFHLHTDVGGTSTTKAVKACQTVPHKFRRLLKTLKLALTLNQLNTIWPGRKFISINTAYRTN